MNRAANDPTSIRRAIATFAASGLLTVALFALVAVELLRRTGTTEAIRDAKQVTRLAGEGIVQPAVSDALARGDPRAVARVDRAVRAHVLRDAVVRVKIWTAGGRIVYSDERRLIGSRYGLGADELETLRNGGVDAEVSDLSRPENRFERRHKKLLEVYLPIHAPSGRPLMFESYLRFSSVSASGRRLWLAFAPAILAALVLLELSQLPLAWRMARRLREGQLEREQLLERALDASDRERRRIAGDLHDGVVQSLAGVSYSLAAAAAAPDAPAPVAETLREAAAETRNGIRELRTLLVDIYPPDLHRAGLEAALDDLIGGIEGVGLEAHAQVGDCSSLPRGVEALFYRVAQEALRNVVRHADARNVELRVECAAGRAELTVADDGRGFDAAAASPEGHFGLRLVEDAARDLGGSLVTKSEPGRGTTVRVEVPVP